MAINEILILIIFIVLGIAIFLCWFIFSWWRRTKKETRKAEEEIEKAFAILKERIGEQVEMLDGQPGLNEDEKKLRDSLRETLNFSEEIVKKEIKEVEKEIG